MIKKATLNFDKVGFYRDIRVQMIITVLIQIANEFSFVTLNIFSL